VVDLLDQVKAKNRERGYYLENADEM